MRIPRLTIDMLVAVIAVAQRKTLEKAAEEIGVITASAVHKRIQATNKLFGVSLFLNTEDGMVLTEEGKVFYMDALHALEQTLLTEERMTAQINLKAGRVLVGRSTYLPAKFLIAIQNLTLGGSSASYQIEHVSSLTETIAQRVVEGTLHVGFGYLPLNSPDLLTRVLWEEPLVVCMPASHRLGVQPSVRPSDLKNEPIIALARNTLPWLHEEISEYIESFGFEPKIVADAFGPQEAVAMVEQKVGLCLLAASSLMRPGTIAKPMEPKILTRKSGIFIREDNRNAAVDALMKLAIETIPPKLRRR